MGKKDLYNAVNIEPLFQTVCRYIWANPEVGGKEHQSADYFRQLMHREGFVVKNEPLLPNAFYAEYGSDKPVIAILGEYDALPGFSQRVAAEREPVISGGAGHGCGHNLLGAASAIAAIAIKKYLEIDPMPGTVRFYGCPEEELLSGKVKMAKYGMFEGCDLAISWHPLNANMVFDKAFLENASVRFEFHGRSSHAAYAPEQGRSALDAVELMSVGINYLREHVLPSARIHYSIVAILRLT